ncbi:MAG: hypothetical protein ACE5DZ_08870 [Mariprofundus sp.]
MNKKQQFIKSQIWSLSVAAAFQRGNVYKKDSAPTDKKKSKFKSELKKIIDSQIERLDAVGSDEYIERLEKLQKQINAMIKEKGFSSGVQHFRFGTLQKLVNLYLKYQWCLGWQPEPHHCPFDGVVLEKLNVSGKWTKSDSAVEYRDWVDEAQEKSKEGSIAQWELKVWNEWLEGESG